MLAWDYFFLILPLMKLQFIIKFIVDNQRYQAEVKVFELEGYREYDIYVTTDPYSALVIPVRIHKGSGKGGKGYWRQRVSKSNAILLDAEFIQIIGKEIEILDL